MEENNKLIINSKQSNLLNELKKNLKECERFYFSVAFINFSGLQLLLDTLKELESRDIKGKIITTTYLNFTEPKALEKLQEFENIDLKVFIANKEIGFHTKAYIFENKDNYKIIIGSSNITQSALKSNIEWNVRIISKEDAPFIKDVLKEYDNLWNMSSELSDEVLQKYMLFLNEIKKMEVKRQLVFESFQTVQPNKMQVRAMENLNRLREHGENKALVIAATGTGKTYMSAFDVRQFNPKRMLFVVHREEILKKAKETFDKVLKGRNIKTGLFTGNKKEYDADYLFATIQTMNRYYEEFDRDYFDYIVIDEAHHAASNSYLNIINYFKAQFTLGMTATPERGDSLNVFDLFDNNVALEVRLYEALEDDLVIPFHYFGITDIQGVDLENVNLDDISEVANRLMVNRRVDFISDKMNFYGHDGKFRKVLGFCANIEHAKYMADEFNKRKIKSVALSGNDSVEKRQEYIKKLESDKDDLQVIFTVDIFNEGVDIPEINQVIMLRQTESPIIFIQQLGRGLRKFEDKEYVVILDFIGNYTNNFMIPLALSGDRSYNKDTLRRYVQAGNRIIPGTSTVHFDKIAKQRIYESIDTARFSDMKLIKEAYFNLRFKLGRIPKIADFADHGSIDVSRIFSKFKSYHHFLIKIKDKDYDISFTPVQERMLYYISQKLTIGMRARELIVLQALLDGRNDIINYVSEELYNNYNVDLSEYGRINLINMMTNRFGVQVAQKTFADSEFIEFSNGKYGISQIFKQALEDNNFREQVQELVTYGFKQFNEKYKDNIYGNTPFALYEKYTYEQVCQLLEWPQNEVPLNIGGYKFHKETKTYPVFINYHKADDIQDTIKYEDRFENPGLLKAISKNKRTFTSDDVQTAFNADALGVAMHLFVRKNKDDEESKEFYYLGPIHSTGQENAKEISMANGTAAVELEYVLEVPVRDDIYDYIVNG